MGPQRTPRRLCCWLVETSEDLLASMCPRCASPRGWEVLFTPAVISHLACPLNPLPFLRVRRALGQAGHYASGLAHTRRTSRL